MSTLPYAIRPLKFEDLATLEAYFPQPKEHSHAKRLKAQHEGHQAYNAIIVDDVIAGILLIRWTGPANAHHHKLSNYPEIGSLFILPHFRSKGLARKLHEHAEALIRAKGIDKAGLAIKNDNLASIDLHLKLGYEPVGPAQPTTNDPDKPRTYYLKQLK